MHGFKLIIEKYIDPEGPRASAEIWTVGGGLHSKVMDANIFIYVCLILYVYKSKEIAYTTHEQIIKQTLCTKHIITYQLSLYRS